MTNIKEIKKELERRYNLVFNIPEEKIDYNFFVLIADYVDWIENNKILKELLYNQKPLKNYPPDFYLIKKS
jgi:hypothetical protein